MRLILLFLCASCLAYGQTSHKLAVGYAERYDSLPALSFERATGEQYGQNTLKQQLIKRAPRTDKTHLFIPVRKETLRLRKYHDAPGLPDGPRGWEYKGYLSLLKMYVLTDNHTSEHIGFSDLILLDSSTAVSYPVISAGDDAVAIPVCSPDGRYLVYYYNYIYKKNSSFIGVLEVDSKNDPQDRLAEMASYTSKDWAVADIKWTDDTSFIVKAYTVQTHGGPKQYEYYKAAVTPRAKEQKDISPAQKNEAGYFYPFDNDSSYVLSFSFQNSATAAGQSCTVAFTQRNNITKPAWKEQLPVQYEETLRREDFNGDGVSDWLLFRGTGGRGSNEFYYLFLTEPSGRQIKRIVQFEELPNPAYNKKYNVILSYGYASSNYYTVYRLTAKDNLIRIGDSFEDDFGGDSVLLDTRIGRLLNDHEQKRNKK